MGALVSPDDNLGAGLLQFAEETFVLDLIEMGLGGEDADDTSGEVADEGRATSGVGKFAIGQPGEESGGVDGLAAFAHVRDAAEDDLVGGMKEVLFAHPLFAGEINDMIGIGEHGAQERAFGLEIVMGKKALNGDGGGSVPAGAWTNGFSFSNHRGDDYDWGARNNCREKVVGKTFGERMSKDE